VLGCFPQFRDGGVIGKRGRVRLLRLDLRCPYCKRSPRFRISDHERDAHADDDPLKVLGSIQCHACDGVYEVAARAYQKAS
jgi:hypothetical protein